jgi:phage terminase large subunit
MHKKVDFSAMIIAKDDKIDSFSKTCFVIRFYLIFRNRDCERQMNISFSVRLG